MIFVGVLSVLGVFTLRQDFAGTDAAGPRHRRRTPWSRCTTGRFLLGPGVMPAINALCLATVLYRSRLVPRIIPTIGLIGAPLLLASTVATLFGAGTRSRPPPRSSPCRSPPGSSPSASR